MRYLNLVLRYLLIAAVAILTTSVFLQVIVRFVIRAPLPWTEELSRIAFVYSIFIGATLGFKDRAHITVDALVASVPPGGRFVLKMISNLLVGILLCFIIFEGASFAMLTGVQVTPVLQIPFRYLYVIIPASGALMLLFLVINTIEDVREARAQ